MRMYRRNLKEMGCKVEDDSDEDEQQNHVDEESNGSLL